MFHPIKERYTADGIRILSLTDVCKVLGISPSTLRKRILSGQFPRPEKYSKIKTDGKVSKGYLSGWREDRLRIFIREMEKFNERR